jgi:hypothetical protein
MGELAAIPPGIHPGCTHAGTTDSHHPCARVTFHQAGNQVGTQLVTRKLSCNQGKGRWGAQDLFAIIAPPDGLAGLIVAG